MQLSIPRIILLLLLCLALGSPLAANRFPDFKGWAVSPGINLAVPLQKENGKVSFGGEVSVFYNDGFFFCGLQSDLLYDFNRKKPVFGIGPEVGLSFVLFEVGLESSLLLREGADNTGEKGFGVQLFTGFSFFAAPFVYFGYSYWPGSNTRSYDLGVLVKIPVFLKGY